ncbi:YbaK/EbsC family protein [Amycolatopsis tolypomycina]|uniref:Cys-tRNA(Pro) deacylase, prolyl-tRNA editing enzyme YbaK/EbsC n=1 Tax=Amycolatopsis tolypomycina TaxID=208445 RepID=A0A1H4QW04_9PSEU|nr:YbaK/EbsC family protein [Amycolatopsis tolypomycina]SEC23823.1 Cys-tRNA(Pro) deacylase, prolyl-tRNA editing enzyme YbaK/EbsC [Amycolatopsis tolypomycina]
MSSLEHPAVAKVAAALAEAGQHAAAEGIRVLPAEVRTAAAAAEALGVPVGAIANSLIFRLGSDKKALLALTSGAHRADPGTLERLAGDTIHKADADFVRAHTGQPIGGVAPVGHPEPLATLVDTALRGHTVVWAAAGHPKAVFPTTFAELVALTGGTPGALGGPEEDGQP